MGIKEKLLNCIPDLFKEAIANEYFSKLNGTFIFSQEGEDKLLQRFLNNSNPGIFVDVGAHHPTLINNTYFFYRSGYRGINIDATPGSMKLFNKLRPYDINIEVPISDLQEDIVFYIFNTPELNTFDETKIEYFLKFDGVKLINEVKLKPEKLSSILDKNLHKFNSKYITFFTIDVEGYDLNVLKSNDWNKYKPKYILAEDLFSDIIDTSKSDLTLFLIEHGYRFVAKTYNTAFYKYIE